MEARILKPCVPLPRRFPDQAEYVRDGETCGSAYAFPAPSRAAKLTEDLRGVVYSQNQSLDVQHQISCGWVPSPVAMRDPGPDQRGSERCHLRLQVGELHWIMNHSCIQ